MRGVRVTQFEDLTEPDGKYAYWAGVIGFEEKTTGDSRIIEKGALRLDTLPVPFRWSKEDNGGHDGAVVVGTVLHVEIRDGGVIWGEGTIDLGSEEGREYYRRVKEGIENGVSMDLDEAHVEVRVAKDEWDRQKAEWDAMNAAMEEGGEWEPERAENGDVIIYKSDPDLELTVLTDTQLRAVTGVAIPAFKDAKIQIVEALEAVTASAAVDLDYPPLVWFKNPEFTEPCPFTLTADGQVYGHIALWGTNHKGARGSQLLLPPHSACHYDEFLLGATLTDEGVTVPTGKVFMRAMHAPLNQNLHLAREHYDHSGTVGADVNVGEDRFGIWIAGAARSTLSDADRRELRAAPMSGDWRPKNGNLELVAVLGVNVPGYPVPRPRALVASGEPVALVASGMLAPLVPDESVLTASDVAWLKRLAVETREAERVRRAEVRNAELAAAAVDERRRADERNRRAAEAVARLRQGDVNERAARLAARIGVVK